MVEGTFTRKSRGASGLCSKALRPNAELDPSESVSRSAKNEQSWKLNYIRAKNTIAAKSAKPAPMLRFLITYPTIQPHIAGACRPVVGGEARPTPAVRRKAKHCLIHREEYVPR